MSPNQKVFPQETVLKIPSTFLDLMRGELIFCAGLPSPDELTSILVSLPLLRAPSELATWLTYTKNVLFTNICVFKIL